MVEHVMTGLEAIIVNALLEKQGWSVIWMTLVLQTLVELQMLYAKQALLMVHINVAAPLDIPAITVTRTSMNAKKVRISENLFD